MCYVLEKFISIIPTCTCILIKCQCCILHCNLNFPSSASFLIVEREFHEEFYPSIWDPYKGIMLRIHAKLEVGCWNQQGLHNPVSGERENDGESSVLENIKRRRDRRNCVCLYVVSRTEEVKLYFEYIIKKWMMTIIKTAEKNQKGISCLINKLQDEHY